MKLITKLIAAALVVWALSWAYAGNEATDTKEWRLFTAVKSDDYVEAQKWLDEGADINARVVRALGETPLRWAVRRNEVDAANWLINSGADANPKMAWTKEISGYTPLHFAAYQNAIDAANLLINAGAQVNARDQWGRTPLHEAVKSNSAEVVNLLIGKGADVNARDVRGATPLASRRLMMRLPLRSY